MPKKGILLKNLKNVLYSGMVTEGKYVIDFEEALQSHFELPVRPLTTNNGTSAIQLAYRACNVKGKLVLATPMTCTATNMPILTEGGQIVWCDIDSFTGNISTLDVEQKIKELGPKRIAAISLTVILDNGASKSGSIKSAKSSNAVVSTFSIPISILTNSLTGIRYLTSPFSLGTVVSYSSL
jgi:hypothetical protein